MRSKDFLKPAAAAGLAAALAASQAPAAFAVTVDDAAPVATVEGEAAETADSGEADVASAIVEDTTSEPAVAAVMTYEATEPEAAPAAEAVEESVVAETAAESVVADTAEEPTVEEPAAEEPATEVVADETDAVQGSGDQQELLAVVYGEDSEAISLTAVDSAAEDEAVVADVAEVATDADAAEEATGVAAAETALLSADDEAEEVYQVSVHYSWEQNGVDNVYDADSQGAYQVTVGDKFGGLPTTGELYQEIETNHFFYIEDREITWTVEGNEGLDASQALPVGEYAIVGTIDGLDPDIYRIELELTVIAADSIVEPTGGSTTTSVWVGEHLWGYDCEFLLADGSTAYMPVPLDAPANYEFTEPGEVTFTGTVAGTDYTFDVTFHVYEVVDATVDPIWVTAGYSLEDLPLYATIVGSDGQGGSYEASSGTLIAWDDEDLVAHGFSTPGTYEITGSVGFWDETLPVTATVTVTAAPTSASELQYMGHRGDDLQLWASAGFTLHLPDQVYAVNPAVGLDVNERSLGYDVEWQEVDDYGPYSVSQIGDSFTVDGYVPDLDIWVHATVTIIPGYDWDDDFDDNGSGTQGNSGSTSSGTGTGTSGTTGGSTTTGGAGSGSNTTTGTSGVGTSGTSTGVGTNASDVVTTASLTTAATQVQGVASDSTGDTLASTGDPTLAAAGATGAAGLLSLVGAWISRKRRKQ